MGVVIGVDSSTQSTKVEVRDASGGALLGEGRAPHPTTDPPCSEQRPQAWWDAYLVARGRAEAAAGLDSATAAQAPLSVAAQQHGLVVLDEQDRVIRPAKLWNDTESASDAAWLIGRLDGGARAWAEACGSVPVAALTVTKLSWLHRREPEAFARTARVLLPHDWLAWRAGGDLVTDRGDASGTGYWSPTTGRYREDLLTIVDDTKPWSRMLPPVAGPGEAGGTGDNMAAALGLGLAPGDVVVSVGTSGTVSTVSTTATADPTGAVCGFADATGRFLPLVCTLNAARVMDAWARVLGVDTPGFDRLALEGLGSADGRSDGPVLVPYLDGERTPDVPDAAGVLSGIRSHVSREQIARAAVEGVVCHLLDAFDALAAWVPTGGRVFLVGGGARSRAVRGMFADLAGRAVTVPDEPDAVARGAAVQAAARAAGVPPAVVQEAWRLGTGAVVEPGPGAERAAEVRAVYAQARDRALS